MLKRYGHPGKWAPDVGQPLQPPFPGVGGGSATTAFSASISADQPLEHAGARALIKLGEGPRIEFKQTLTHLPKVAKTLCALANNRGGVVLVGVQDNKNVCGAETDEESFMALQAARDWCRPSLDVTLREEEVEGHNVLLIYVPESPDKPHECRDKDGAWKVYVRSDDKCVIADRATGRALEAAPTHTEREEATRRLSHNELSALEMCRSRHKLNAKDLAKRINVSRQRAAKLLYEMSRAGLLFQTWEAGVPLYIIA